MKEDGGLREMISRTRCHILMKARYILEGGGMKEERASREMMSLTTWHSNTYYVHVQVRKIKK